VCAPPPPRGIIDHGPEETIGSRRACCYLFLKDNLGNENLLRGVGLEKGTELVQRRQGIFRAGAIGYFQTKLETLQTGPIAPGDFELSDETEGRETRDTVPFKQLSHSVSPDGRQVLTALVLLTVWLENTGLLSVVCLFLFQCSAVSSCLHSSEGYQYVLVYFKPRPMHTYIKPLLTGYISESSNFPCIDLYIFLGITSVLLKIYEIIATYVHRLNKLNVANVKYTDIKLEFSTILLLNNCVTIQGRDFRL
jgi:hypothetical protein